MPRIRDFGITPGYLPTGPLNAITDVTGVRVGHTTIHRDVDGVSWRTGVTAIWPHAGNPLVENIYAAVFPLNGLGEMTGRSLIDEWGLLGFPIMLTGTNSVGIVYHWTLQYLFEHCALEAGMTSLIAMVAECDDSNLDGSKGMAIGREDVYAALDNAAGGPVIEGCVGAGTGMQLFGFKGGIGTSSRLVQAAGKPYTVGVLVLTNFGIQRELIVNGIPVGRLLSKEELGAGQEGSCIVVLATDAPLNHRQCERMAKRAALGLARTGSTARDGSGEIIVAFATGNIISSKAGPEISVRTLIEGSSDAGTSPLNGLFTAAVEATEEAVYNALVSAETTRGAGGHVLEAISHERLRTLLQR
ncbi:MAG TPA: P1 family peptidase [Ktedonobacteraceae bacterium]|jgi:D-aminopeptidase|nr:P1 family peptidase [Ktedonobacteraceae bacterium]